MRIVALIITLLTCLAACEPTPSHSVRIATFNVAMGLEEFGQLGQALANGNYPRLQQLAAILQDVRPDIVLLNEFDFDPMVDAATLFNDNYLAHGPAPIYYPYHFRAPVNTGMGSGLDLDWTAKPVGPQTPGDSGDFRASTGCWCCRATR